MLPDGFSLRPVGLGDAASLAAAYAHNREHLAPWDPLRTEDFFTERMQRVGIEQQLQAVERGQVDAWVLWHGDRVTGRININNIIRGVLQSASIGYWLDRDHLGRGLATEMVEFAVRRAEHLRLHRLEAGTLVHNEASQKVLLRSGFVHYGTAPEFLHIAGRWQDHHLYQRILHDRPAGNPVA